jgi:hypothetical protein
MAGTSNQRTVVSAGMGRVPTLAAANSPFRSISSEVFKSHKAGQRSSQMPLANQGCKQPWPPEGN